MKILFIIFMFLFCGCAMFHHEAERAIQSDVKKYLNSPEGIYQVNGMIEGNLSDNFNRYADTYYHDKIQQYKGRFNWLIGSVSAFIAGLGGAKGVDLLRKKNKLLDISNPEA